MKEYVSVPSYSNLLSSYLDFFTKKADIAQNQRNEILKQNAPEESHGDISAIETSGGVVEIPLGMDARAGDIFYSGEIIHGLGMGNVYVEVGYEFVYDDPNLNKRGRSIIYGNSRLFDEKELPNAETAVKVLNDKGSFVVAVKLLENVDFLTLTYRWIAIRFPSGEDIRRPGSVKDKSISAITPTFIMAPKESHYFDVRYHNMEPASVTYALSEPASGEITADGIYTAPSKEGVYEIQIYCTDNSLISTYAYAIVKKKDDDK